MLDETILEKGAKHLYSEYLKPKVRPYTVIDTMKKITKVFEVG